jgi:hypothetical protein
LVCPLGTVRLKSILAPLPSVPWALVLGSGQLPPMYFSCTLQVWGVLGWETSFRPQFCYDQL